MATNNPNSYKQKVTKFGKILAFFCDNGVILQEECFIKFFWVCCNCLFRFIIHNEHSDYSANTQCVDRKRLENGEKYAVGNPFLEAMREIKLRLDL